MSALKINVWIIHTGEIRILQLKKKVKFGKLAFIILTLDMKYQFVMTNKTMPFGFGPSYPQDA